MSRNRLLTGHSRVADYPMIQPSRQLIYADLKRIYKDWPGSLFDLHYRGLSKPHEERIVPWWIAQACLGYEPKDDE